jgi:hypothetical protein
MSEDGSDYTSGHLYAKEDANEDKNHQYGTDPRVNISSPQPGMIMVDDRGYVFLVLSGPVFQELHKGGEIVCFEEAVVCFEGEVVYDSPVI